VLNRLSDKSIVLNDDYRKILRILTDKFFDVFLTHRHIGHIGLHKVLIIKGLYIILCVLCAYVLKKRFFC
jgi:hypothetical protein